ncbi:unnamed protein product [Rhizophagus irregularis]|nr:unnamed protein product [Rhizophagus irregularis]
MKKKNKLTLNPISHSESHPRSPSQDRSQQYHQSPFSHSHQRQRRHHSHSLSSSPSSHSRRCQRQHHSRSLSPLPPLTLVDVDIDIILVLNTIIIISLPLPPLTLVDVDVDIILILSPLSLLSLSGRSLTKRNLPDLSEGGQQQHHQEEQSSQSLEIQELKSAVSQLSSRLEALTGSNFSHSSDKTIASITTSVNRSLSPVISRNKGKKLSPMTPIFKKTLRDEVVQIINNLGSRISFNVSQTFSDQKKSINKKLLPAVKAAMNPSIEVYDTEIVNVIKQLHKSHRDIWKITQDGKLDTHSRRQHITSWRDQKMTRRKRGLQHMINTKDKVLNDCKPQEIT